MVANIEVGAEIPVEQLDNLMQMTAKADALQNSMAEMDAKMENFLKNQPLFDESWEEKSEEEKMEKLEEFTKEFSSMTKSIAETQNLAMQPQDISVLDEEMNSLMPRARLINIRIF